MTETNNKTDVREQFAPEVEPWPATVDGSCINEAVAQIQRNFLMEEDLALTGVLWTAMTYCFQEAEFEYSPRLIITSPGPGHGKTRLLEALGYMTERRFGPVIPTSAAYIRIASREQRPTMLFDEGDKLFGKKGDTEMTNALNAAFQRSGMYLKCNESNFDDLHPKYVYGPDALCGIDLHMNMMGSTLERSLVIPMVKARYGQITEKFKKKKHQPVYLELGRKLKRFVIDNLEDIRNREPTFPELPDERFEDKWWICLAIAEAASETLAQRVRNIIKTEAEAPSREDWQLNLILGLCDIYSQLHGQWTMEKGDNMNLVGIGATPASQLLTMVEDDERGGERQWSTFNANNKFRKSDAIGPDQVTKALGSYGIRKRTLRCADGELMMGFPWKEILEIRNQYSDVEYVPGEDELSEASCNQLIDYPEEVVPF